MPQVAQTNFSTFDSPPVQTKLQSTGMGMGMGMDMVGGMGFPAPPQAAGGYGGQSGFQQPQSQFQQVQSGFQQPQHQVQQVQPIPFLQTAPAPVATAPEAAVPVPPIQLLSVNAAFDDLVMQVLQSFDILLSIVLKYLKVFCLYFRTQYLLRIIILSKIHQRRLKRHQRVIHQQVSRTLGMFRLSCKVEGFLKHRFPTVLPLTDSCHKRKCSNHNSVCHRCHRKGSDRELGSHPLLHILNLWELWGCRHINNSICSSYSSNQ